MRRWRSLLFVPGDNSERLCKAASRGADAIIVDLEDGVANAAKSNARAALATNAAALRAAGADVIVRINASWREAYADLDAAILADVTAIMVPKVEDSAQLSSLSEIISELEHARALVPKAISLVALVETPAALSHLAEIAATERVSGIALGSEDFSLALGVAPTANSLDLPCRQIALTAAIRGQMALAVPVSIAAFRDEPMFQMAAVAARAFGSTGALCIHPAQVRIANDVFKPSDAEYANAKAILAAWAEGRGDAVGVITLNGKMIDKPIVAQAHRTISLMT